MADLESAAPETFGVSVEQVSALAPLVTLEAAADTDPVYSDDGRVDISRADVEGWIQAVAARVDLRLAGRSRITDEPRTKTLRAAAHDAVVNGAASYLVAAATPTRASLNDAGSYDAVLWARYESALDGAGLALDGWLETADPAATEIRARMSGNFPLPAFPDGFRFQPVSGLHFEGGGLTPFVLTLERFQHRLGDASTAFGAMADYQKKVVNARQFKSEGSAEVGQWSPLSPKYAAWKAKVRPGARLLVFDGDLKKEMTTPGAGVYEVWSSGFTVGSDLFYATYHQNGTKNMPARPLQGERRKSDTRKLTKILQAWIVEGKIGAVL